MCRNVLFLSLFCKYKTTLKLKVYKNIMKYTQNTIVYNGYLILEGIIKLWLEFP